MRVVVDYSNQKQFHSQDLLNFNPFLNNLNRQDRLQNFYSLILVFWLQIFVDDKDVVNIRDYLKNINDKEIGGKERKVRRDPSDDNIVGD